MGNTFEPVVPVKYIRKFEAHRNGLDSTIFAERPIKRACENIESEIREAKTKEEACAIICKHYQNLQKNPRVMDNSKLQAFNKMCNEAIGELSKFPNVNSYLEHQERASTLKNVDTGYQNVAPSQTSARNSIKKEDNIPNQIKAAVVLLKDHLGMNPLKRVWISRTVPYAGAMKEIREHLKTCKTTEEACKFVKQQYKDYQGKNKEGFKAICDKTIQSLSNNKLRSLEDYNVSQTSKNSRSSYKL